MPNHSYENALGTSYLEGGRYRDRIHYKSKHSIGKFLFNKRIFQFGFLILTMLFHYGNFEDSILQFLNKMIIQGKTWVDARVNAPKWVLGGGAYVILSMMAVTIFRG